jgi:HAD superfamily hydrolase (TIGR01450 family)
MPVTLARPDRLYEAYIFDLDGTLILGERDLPGARDLIVGLHERGIPVLFATNNPTKRPAEIVARLVRAGIPATAENVLSTLHTTTHWLANHAAGARVFAMGEAPLHEALVAAGIPVSDDPAEIDILLASYDRTFDYRKLQIAFDAVHRHGVSRLMATNPDRYCPFPDGRGEPDAAAIVGAVAGCTGLALERHFGKPDPVMLETALARIGRTAADCLMVGDRLSTDIRMAIDAGMPSALPLTGETTLATLEAIPDDAQPTWIVDRVDHLLP